MCPPENHPLSGAISAGHDRSDGGLASVLLEMAFAGQVGCGLDVDVPAGGDGVLDALFSEEVYTCVCLRFRPVSGKALSTRFHVRVVAAVFKIDHHREKHGRFLAFAQYAARSGFS